MSAAISLLHRAAAVLACTTVVAATPARAVDLAGRVALGVQAGSTGIGVEGALKLNDVVVLRGAVEGFKAQQTVSAAGHRYHADGSWLTDSGMVDVHPGGGPFLLSLGIYYGQRKLRLRSVAGGSNDGVEGRAKLSGVAPYFAVGWDNSLHGADPWGVKVRAGFILSDTPDVDLSAAGAGIDSAALRARERGVAEDLRGARFWPLLQAGVSYRF